MSVEVNLEEPTRVEISAVELREWPLSQLAAPMQGVVLEAMPIKQGKHLAPVRFRVAPSQDLDVGEVYKILRHLHSGPEPTVWVKKIGVDQEDVPVCVVVNHNVWEEEEKLRQFILRQEVRVKVERAKGVLAGLLGGVFLGYLAGRYLK